MSEQTPAKPSQESVKEGMKDHPSQPSQHGEPPAGGKSKTPNGTPAPKDGK